MMLTQGWTDTRSPFHAGEQAIQERFGVRAMMEDFGRQIIRKQMPDQHRAFYRQLPFIVLGHAAPDGRPWASIVPGTPGFITTPDATTLAIDATPLPGDPLAANLRHGMPIGVVGVDLAARRRNRLAGRVSGLENGRITLAVDQAFGNCPQYIQTRELEVHERAKLAVRARRVDSLGDAERTLISEADTFFVASIADAAADEDPDLRGADVSHRGGRKGFVHVADDGTLTIPDFSGNNHFNTLGNFQLTPKAGLLFVDFETGDLLTLTGTVELIWDGPEVDAFSGAEMIWRFRMDHGYRLPAALDLKWTFGEFSPNSLLNGTWDAAAATLRAQEKGEEWRPYRITKIKDESSVIRSLYLQPDDGDGLLPFEAGQYLTLRLPIGENGAHVIRTYTISNAPGDGGYRLSIKREGLASSYLHDAVSVGSVLEARAPRGDFTFDAGAERPAVLLAGGVGITPMIAMLRHAVREGLRTRHFRPVTLVYAARDSAQRAFHDEINALVQAGQGAIRAVSVLGAVTDSEKPGVDFNVHGRLSKELLRTLLALDDYDFYLCGPQGFMQAGYEMLRELGVRDARIFAEAFGPAALRRLPDSGAESPPLLEEAAEQAIVRFAESGLEMPWTRQDGSLLEFAESHGLRPDHGCRTGTCGMCAVAVTAGTVTYRSAPRGTVAAGQALICQAVPAKSASGTEVVEVAL